MNPNSRIFWKVYSEFKWSGILSLVYSRFWMYINSFPISKDPILMFFFKQKYVRYIHGWFLNLLRVFPTEPGRTWTTGNASSSFQVQLDGFPVDTPLGDCQEHLGSCAALSQLPSILNGTRAQYSLKSF